MPRESRNAAAVRCSVWFGGAPVCVGLPSPQALPGNVRAFSPSRTPPPGPPDGSTAGSARKRGACRRRQVRVGRTPASAHRFLHERADPCLFCGGQLLQREGDRPHGAFVEVRILVEAERHVPLLELLRVAEEADDLTVL